MEIIIIKKKLISMSIVSTSVINCARRFHVELGYLSGTVKWTIQFVVFDFVTGTLNCK